MDLQKAFIFHLGVYLRCRAAYHSAYHSSKYFPAVKRQMHFLGRRKYPYTE